MDKENFAARAETHSGDHKMRRTSTNAAPLSDATTRDKSRPRLAVGGKWRAEASLWQPVSGATVERRQGSAPRPTLADRLDDPSRSAVEGAVARVAILSACALAPRIFGAYSVADFLSVLGLAFAVGGGAAALSASVRRERLGQSLGSWDEALAFNGLALLAMMAHRLV
jgi:hypothetical protein